MIYIAKSPPINISRGFAYKILKILRTAGAKIMRFVALNANVLAPATLKGDHPP